jgi:dihydropyrimidine dehydrogenase (NAD+) subunit PreA
MVETKKEWKDIIQRSQDSGADGLELNFGCPHGMCENGMGSAVGEEPKILKRITSWVSEMSTLPVIIKLTPNVTDINITAKAGIEGGANGISIINTVKSIIGVNLDKMIPEPVVGNFSTNGGYCGPAVKPIALYMLAQLAKNPKIKIPISGIGGISNWYDAAEFISLGATSVQVCTAVMNYGYRIILDMLDGLNNFLIDKKFKSLNSLFGRAIPLLKSWKDLNLKYRVVASIDPKSCVGCNLCYIACLDGGHQSILLPDIKKNDIHKTGHSVEAFNFVFNQNKGNSSIPIIYEPDCVGCNLCKYVCPIEDCITMEQR